MVIDIIWGTEALHFEQNVMVLCVSLGNIFFSVEFEKITLCSGGY